MWLDGVPGYQIDEDEKLAQVIRRSHQQVTGNELPLEGTRAAANVPHFVHWGNVPALYYGASYLTAHSDHERVELAQVVRRQRYTSTRSLPIWALRSSQNERQAPGCHHSNIFPGPVAEKAGLDVEKSILAPLGVDLVKRACSTEAELVEAGKEAVALLVGNVPITAEVLSQLPRCLAIVKPSVGVDNIGRRRSDGGGRLRRQCARLRHR